MRSTWWGRGLCASMAVMASLVIVPAIGQSKTKDKAAPKSIPKTAVSLTGSYTRLKQRKDENQSAVLDVQQVSPGKIKFHLTALWWPVGRKDPSPHNGEIEATATLKNNLVTYKQDTYRLTLHFQGDKVMLTEQNANSDFGANVTAAGIYMRTSKRMPKFGR